MKYDFKILTLIHYLHPKTWTIIPECLLQSQSIQARHLVLFPALSVQFVTRILLLSKKTALSMITYVCLSHLDEPSWPESTLHWTFLWPMSSNQINMTKDHWIFFTWKQSDLIFHFLFLVSALECLTRKGPPTEWGYTFSDGHTQTSKYYLEFFLLPMHEHLQ